MKTLKRLIATIVAGILSFPYLLMAQDEGTYIDNLGVQDSSYMEQDLLAEGTQSSGSGNTVIIIVVVVIVIAALGYLVMKKKKKK
ncbi:MAG: LPXTG cell wall anchor domain-containing protein [Mariniphaga sp.]|jgi:LPXTG-motif cell wall-anchored protein|nr:LPXTG cell wall anchor domain-containing protein [Mariniphaga sp.]